MKFLLYALSILFVGLGCSFAETMQKDTSEDKSIIIDIPTDKLPPPSAEEVAPTHPFFSATSTGVEVMEQVEELKERIENLEKRLSILEKEKK